MSRQKRQFTGKGTRASNQIARRRKETSRLERAATIFPFDLRGARTSAAGTHGARCTHTCSSSRTRALPFYAESSVPEYLPMLIYSSVTRRDPLSPVPIGLRASLYETTQRFTSISYVAKVREDETRRRVECYARGRELRASSFDRLPRSYGVFKSHATGNRFRSCFVSMDREEEGGGFFRVSIFDSVKNLFSLSLCLSRFFFRVEGIIRVLRRSGGVNDVCSSSPLYRHS